MAPMRAQQPLRIFFIPFMTPGHMIPMLDIAKLFARRGIAASIITTSGNEPFVRPTIDSFNAAANSITIDLVLIPFPPSIHHLLPNGKENLASISSSDHLSFFHAFAALKGPFSEFILDARPDCVISDAMFAWTADTAAALGVPRLAFYGPGIFVHCVHESLERQLPRLKLGSDSEPFVVEGLPHRIRMTKREISAQLNEFTIKMLREGEDKSYGVIVNSFYELEPEYADLYGKKPGRKAYYVGPAALSNPNRDTSEIDVINTTAKWLDSKQRDSVIYVSFGSLNEFSSEQLREIALGFENSGHYFVWAIKNCKTDGQELLPTEFEEKMKGKGLIIRGWAPQTVILNHPAIGGFLTHCGWNSTLESISAGVPMVAWPVGYDQFLNEKLITEMLEIGVSVERDSVKMVKAEEIAKAVKDVMGKEKEAGERRVRAKKYAAMAKAAVVEGGSSYGDVGRLIDEIKIIHGKYLGNCFVEGSDG